MTRPDIIRELAARVVALLGERSLTIATAESCTGGAVSQAITSVAGCSAVMRGAVVAYHNDVKSAVLGVSADTLATVGAVSEDVVRLMAGGVSRIMSTDCAIATSGVAGPGGGTPEKPVGTVWVALKVCDEVKTTLLNLSDYGRDANIDNCVCEVLGLLHDLLVRRIHVQGKDF